MGTFIFTLALTLSNCMFLFLNAEEEREKKYMDQSYYNHGQRCN